MDVGAISTSNNESFEKQKFSVLLRQFALSELGWQLGNHAEEIYSEKFLWSKIDYIHFNPVRAGLVSKPQDYIYSSASNYVDAKGIIDVAIVRNPVVNVLNSTAIVKYMQYE